MDTSRFSCLNEECPDYGVEATGTSCAMGAMANNALSSSSARLAGNPSLRTETLLPQSAHSQGRGSQCPPDIGRAGQSAWHCLYHRAQ